MEKVIIYADANFSGRAQELGPGNYDMGQLAVGNDIVSSLRVPGGWTVTLFEHAGFQGRSKTFTGDTWYVGDDFNDRASSIRISAPAVVATGDTTNALSDFDMCLAISEGALNAQIARAWPSWLSSSGFTPTLDIFTTLKNGQLVPSPFGVHVEMAPLTLSLSVPNGRPGQVQVTLNWQAGTVKYFDEAEGVPAELAIQGWSFTFISDLNRRAVDMNILEQLDPTLRDAVQRAIARASLPDDIFAVESLFLDVTHASGILEDNRALHTPQGVPDAARDRGAAAMRYFLQSMKPFMLGTVVRPRRDPRLTTFALSDLIFDLDPVNGRAGLSSLNYLGVFAQRALPTNQAEALGRLGDLWVRSGQAHGVLAIGKGAFIERYLLPQFTARIGVAPSGGGLSWTYSGGNNESWTSSDIIDREWSRGKEWSLTIAIVPGTNQLRIGGRVASRATMEGYTKRFNIGMGEWGHHHTEWIRMAGHRDLSGTVELTTAVSGSDLQLVPRVSYSFGAMAVDNDSVGGGANVLTAFEGAFTGGTTAERLQSQQQDMVQHLSSWLNDILAAINLNFSNQTFIPPGDGVFIFQNPRFSGAGDLLFDVVYEGS